MGDDYIHGFTEAEQSRLTRMQAILNQAELDALDLAGVRSLLDVGAGLAQMTRTFARALGAGSRVLGVERDPRQLAEARRQAEAEGEADRIELRQGDAESLPLRPEERGTFDLVHARFLLEHVPDPAAVVRAMAEAARPGGRLVLMDDDHDLLRLWPDCPEADRVWRIYWESYRDRGRDPLVGRRLAALLDAAGVRPMRITTVFYGAATGAPLFDPVVDNLIGVLAGAAGELERSGRIEPTEMEAGLEALGRWRLLPGATLWYSLPLAEGVRPGPA
jgi:SAM-dependent methyltransferase